MAYHSDESGGNEVYVRPFPGPGAKWPISPGGGSFPAWSRARQELFYQALDNRIMVASWTVEGDSFKAGKPQVCSRRAILQRRIHGALVLQRSFALHPDGNRLAAAVAPDRPADTKQDHVTFVFNFFDELRRLAPIANR